ncbi:MAG: hypothetical protein V4549_07790 [Bacteroidota bacterium]
MNFLEKDLEKIIFETPNEHLRSGEFWVNGIKKRQLRIGNYGVADLVTCHRNYDLEFMEGLEKPIKHPYAEITVYELKQKEVNIKTLIQGARYCAGIRNYLDKRKLSFIYKINLVLIGNSFNVDSDILYLEQLFENLSIVTYKIIDDVVSFEYHSGFERGLLSEGFNIKNHK